ncbi:iron-siderophore ABC transporter substrate-binding protein [Paenibacillus validus]|uniref:ABC transporter substrate-binding protein n=1 Tax=Paenibacillus validus TaxID=44253 RepID=A0A7X2ZD71_9BACL|nr:MULTISPECIES: iron-siderophore ABC transporter substrate-binding protein [Paenibacillus]MED4601949.1 iron-siderophore ABC transporter substrate-binding protein [Paenibacillus validus]MED4607270.1 iron-siderophore ABC transporter substrate-binding protein [Paenibacillus validus]MUG72778.1 ABC transporter substrate-binding protein [Paenibacillus validus]
MVRSNKYGLVLAAIFLFMFVIAGCGGNQQGGAVSQPTQVQETENQEARVIQHAMGTTEVKGTPKKVVTLFQGATDAALVLKVKPVGAVESWIEQPWYNYIRAQMEGATNLGSENQPDLEKLVSLQPDLIIASKTRHEKIYQQLSAIAPTVMTEEVHLWKDTLKLSAEALNKKEEEKQFLTEWERKVTDFKGKMGDKLKLEVGIVDFRVDHARIVYTGFSALVLDELGIARPASQRGTEWGVQLSSKENIPQMDADIIFDQTSTTRNDGRLDLRKAWSEHPLWKNLKAVQNNRVFEVDTAVWNNGSGPLAAMEMLDDLYAFYGLK